MSRPWSPQYRVPPETPVSEIFIDESGSKATRARFFVLGMIKVRDSALLQRELSAIRARHSFNSEFKFSNLTRDALPAYFDACELLGRADIRIGAYIFNKDERDPFSTEHPTWQVQSDCIARLVRGNINKGELISLFLDVVSTPRGISIAQNVRQSVNHSFGCTSVVSSLDLDSRSTDLLQMADLVASAVSYERRVWTGEHPDNVSVLNPKGQVVKRLQRCLDLDSFDDVHIGKANIMTATASIDTTQL